jgi:Tol biopolymer transport system component
MQAVRNERRTCAPVFVVLVALVVSMLVPTPRAQAAVAGNIRLVSRTPTGQPGAVHGSGPTGVSADGKYVVFESSASNLIPGQTGTAGGVFLYDRSTGLVSLVSHVADSPTAMPNDLSYGSSISADGAFVVFQSHATNVVAGQNDPNMDCDDIFLFERATGLVTLVSHAPGSTTTTANNCSRFGALSADGSIVTFTSGASNLVAGQVDNNGQGGIDVFIYVRSTGTVHLVSHAAGSTTATGNGTSQEGPTISADGAFVAYVSGAGNLVTGQSDPLAGSRDVFLFDRSTGANTLVSHVPGSPTTAGSGGETGGPRISRDGSFIAFSSLQTNIVSGQNDANGTYDMFLYDRVSGVVTLISHLPGAPASTPNNYSFGRAISDDGGRVAFSSAATNLVTGQSDTNDTLDMFVFERSTGTVRLMSHVPGSTLTAANAGSESASMTSDASYIAFESRATNLVAGASDTNSAFDVFLFETSSGTVSLVSHAFGSPTTAANAVSGSPFLSADGKDVAFGSSASNVLAGQASGPSQAYLFQRLATPTPLSTASDFDGDRDSDISVFRASDNAWYVRNGSTVPFGAAGDVPVPCDYDGNGTTDIAVFRPSIGGWFIEGQPSVFVGGDGDAPVPADYDGDGDCDAAVFRPSVGGWYRNGGDTAFLGLSGDIPVPGDYDGDGDDDITVYRPSVGGWYRLDAPTVFHGLSSDIPTPADYDGNGAFEMAVFRPSVGGWYVPGQAVTFLGLSGDIPVPATYGGAGGASRAVFRPATGAWYVGNDPPLFFGLSGDRPLPLPSAIRQAFFP